MQQIIWQQHEVMKLFIQQFTEQIKEYEMLNIKQYRIMACCMQLTNEEGYEILHLAVHIVLKVFGYTSIFLPYFAKGNNFRDFLFAYLEDEVFQKGSTHKGKNLLQWEQILSFMR